MRYPIRLLLILAILPLLASCGSRQETADGFDKALNATTLVVDPLYASVVVGCDMAEGLLIAREPNGAAAALKLQTLRGTCDGIFQSIEALRDLQRSARGIIDDYRNGELELSSVVQAITPITQAVEHIKNAVATFRRTYGSEAVQEPEEPPSTSDLGAWPDYLDRELSS